MVISLLIPGYAEEDYDQILSSENGTLNIGLSVIPQLENNSISKLHIGWIDPELNTIQEHIDFKITVVKDDQNIFGPILLTHTSVGTVNIPVEFTSLGEHQVIVETEGILFQLISTETTVFTINIEKVHLTNSIIRVEPEPPIPQVSIFDKFMADTNQWIISFTTRIADIESELESQKSVNQDLQEQLDELKNRPMVIPSDINFLEFDERITKLENTVENQNDIIDELNKKIKKLHTNSTTFVYEKIVINEVDINPPGDDSASINEWVELYNPTDSEIDLGVWEIASTTVLKKTMTILAGTTIQPREFLTFSYQSIWFTDSFESVELRDENGIIIDKTPLLSDLANDFTSWQRIYDGYDSNNSGDWKFVTSTAGSSNT